MESPPDLGDLVRIQPARDQDWEPVKEAITQLYWTEERELREVMKIMEERHNFYATERQYKTRFKKWKLEKNVDSKRMKAIVRIQKRRREDENKETEFSFRGRPVMQEKIDRWQKRRQSGKKVASPHRLAAPTPSGIEYGTPASPIVSAPSAHSAQGLPSPGGMPDLLSAPSLGGLVFNAFSPPAEGNLPIGSGHAAGQPFGMIHPPGQQEAWAGYPQLERPGSRPLPLPSRDLETDLFGPVLTWDAGTQSALFSDQAPQMLIDGGSDPGALIVYATQTGENRLWPAMTNNTEVHTHLQVNTSVDENGCTATDDFLYGESNPIDIPGMEIDTESMSSDRRPQLDASVSNPRSSSPDSSSSAPHETERLIVQENTVRGGTQVIDGDIAMDAPRQIERPRAVVSYNRIGGDLRVMGGNVGKEAASDFLKSFFK